MTHVVTSKHMIFVCKGFVLDVLFIESNKQRLDL